MITLGLLACEVCRMSPNSLNNPSRVWGEIWWGLTNTLESFDRFYLLWQLNGSQGGYPEGNRVVNWQGQVERLFPMTSLHLKSCLSLDKHSLQLYQGVLNALANKCLRVILVIHWNDIAMLTFTITFIRFLLPKLSREKVKIFRDCVTNSA